MKLSPLPVTTLGFMALTLVTSQAGGILFVVATNNMNSTVCASSLRLLHDLNTKDTTLCTGKERRLKYASVYTSYKLAAPLKQQVKKLQVTLLVTP